MKQATMLHTPYIRQLFSVATGEGHGDKNGAKFIRARRVLDLV
jgi:hypothetical protein